MVTTLNDQADITGTFYLSEDGFVELLKKIELYYEELSSNMNPEIGTLERKLFKCRLYCNFSGKPVSRNNIRIYTSIDLINKKYKSVLNKI